MRRYTGDRVYGGNGGNGGLPYHPYNPFLFPIPPPERKKSRSPSSRESGPDKTLPSSLSYTSSGDSQRKDTMLNFLPNALFTALSSVSSKAPLFMLIFLTGVSGLFTGST